MTDRDIIAGILADLYAADPSLRAEEDRLAAAVRALLAAKPEAPLDDVFRRRLRDDLLARFSSVRPRPRPLDRFLNLLTMKKDNSLRYLVPGGAAVAVLLVAVVALSVPPRAPGAPASAPSAPTRLALGQGVVVTKAGAAAFGALSAAQGAGATDAAASGHGGGGGEAMPTSMIAPQEPMPETKIGMPIYHPTFYRFVPPAEIPAGDEHETVYRRVKDVGAAFLPESLRSASALALLDAARLGDLRVQSLSLLQDKDFGYSISLDAGEGTVSMSENYLRWPHPEQKCQDDACFAKYRLQESDMPSADDEIAVADGFLRDLGVDRSSYGKPTVQGDWRPQFEAMAAADRATFVFPDVVSVVYPLRIDGKEVRDQGGAPSGLVVNVNLREKKGDGLWNLMTTTYQSSDYVGMTDAAAIKDAVTRGGPFGAAPPEGEKVVDVPLGAPERVLMRAWSGNEEVIVPALRFPVVTKPAGETWFQDSVMVPLVKDLFTAPTGMPVITPFVK
jgi:hypothetical protein